MPRPDDQRAALRHQARTLESQAKYKTDPQEARAFRAGAKLLRDPGFERGLDEVYDKKGDDRARTDPKGFFRDRGADVPDETEFRFIEGSWCWDIWIFGWYIGTICIYW
jgi:hypothetical protein